MSKSRPIVVHPDQELPEPALATERRQFYDRDETYVYVIRGSVTTDFGPGGGESIVARGGDFFVVPSQTVHRETTGRDADVEAFVLRVGGEPEHVSVDGPE